MGEMREADTDGSSEYVGHGMGTDMAYIQQSHK